MNQRSRDLQVSLQAKLSEMDEHLKALADLDFLMSDQHRRHYTQLAIGLAYVTEGVKTFGADLRVVFTIDDHYWNVLTDMCVEGRYDSRADVIRESLQVLEAARSWHKAGFTELVCRNPRTGQERLVVIPSLREVHGR